VLRVRLPLAVSVPAFLPVFLLYRGLSPTIAAPAPSEALVEYAAALKNPNRFDALYGSAQAAQLEGNRAQASKFFAKLVAISSLDADRSELRNAREYVGQQSPRSPRLARILDRAPGRPLDVHRVSYRERAALLTFK
jgi:hypothetical protein